MRKIFLPILFSLMLVSLQSMAQGQAKINGTVTDQKKSALSSVTVSLLKAADSSLIKAAVTDASGKFEIPVSSGGDYLLSYVLVGYEPKYSTGFTLTEGQNLTVNTEALTIAAVKLTGVTITSKKPMIEVKADKTVFNVEASINAQGSNALELLQKSPGVQVDNNDNISMKGKTGVKVYIDGKMQQLDTKDLAAYLKSINSNDIEAIEMISNPSAKYDASGNAGIINIRLKKNKKFGTNGSMNLGFVQGFTPKGNGSVALNYRDKKINVFGNLGGNIGKYRNTLDLYRIQNDTLYDQKSKMNSDDKSFNVKAGVDYFINNKNTIGILGTVNYGDNQWANESVTDVSYFPTGVYVKKLKAFNTVPGNRMNSNFNLNYRYADTSGREINFDGDYGRFRGTGRSYQPNYYYLPNGNLLNEVINRNYTPTDIDIYTAKIDAEQRLGKGKLGYGLKTSFVTTKNTFDFYNDVNGVPVKQLKQSNSFKYTENVNAAYVNYQRQLTEKWSIQAGLRAEQTNSDGKLTRGDDSVQADNRVKRHYFDLFPSAAVTWNINQKHSLNLTYSRRIDRPTYQDLNPFENKLDELTYEKGNAFLRPQYTQTVELTHTFMGMINTTVGYSYVKDYATQTTDTVKNATFVQQKNLARQQIFSANMGSSLPIKKWWNGYANIWYNYQLFDGIIGENAVNGLGFSSYGAYLQQSFSLGHDYTAEISGWYNGPSVWGGTWKTKPQGGVDVGLQKQLMKKKASIKIAATDIFHTAPWKAVNDFGGLYIKGGGSWESQTVRVSFSWRFGNSQVKSQRERQTGLESESKRIKGGN